MTQPQPLQIIALSGSLRSQSFNTALLRATPGLGGTARAQTNLRVLLFGLNMIPSIAPSFNSRKLI